MAPEPYPTDLKHRYSRDMFDFLCPEVVPGPGTRLVSRLLVETNSFEQAVGKPLKPTGQPESGAWGFFEQGIILGAIVYILPAMGAMAFGLGYAVWKGLCTWKRMK
jgi:aldehyde dehydrogenase (NAD+)